MARTKAGGWIAGAIVLMLAITAATWFLAAQPRFADAGATTAQAQDVRDQNDLLQQKIVKLKADFAKLDEYRAQLAEIQTQIPAEAMLTDYTRSLQGAADASGVTLLDINPGTAVQVVVPVVAAPPTPTPTPTDSGAAASRTDVPAHGAARRVGGNRLGCRECRIDGSRRVRRDPDDVPGARHVRPGSDLPRDGADPAPAPVPHLRP